MCTLLGGLGGIIVPFTIKKNGVRSFGFVLISGYAKSVLNNKKPCFDLTSIDTMMRLAMRQMSQLGGVENFMALQRLSRKDRRAFGLPTTIRMLKNAEFERFLGITAESHSRSAA